MQRGKDFAQARKLEPFGFGRAPVADQNGADGVRAKHQRRPSEHAKRASGSLDAISRPLCAAPANCSTSVSPAYRSPVC